MAIKLKPVVYTQNHFTRGAQNTTQQMLLLKALQVTQDPQKLRQMIGVHTVADVYRTMDKLAMRREYHDALSRAGIDFDFIVKGLKNVAETAFKDDTKLKAYQTLLKSLGMEKYDDAAPSGGTWEDALLKKLDEDKQTAPGLPAPEDDSLYDVKPPQIPQSVIKAKEEERELTDSIYDSPVKPTPQANS